MVKSWNFETKEVEEVPILDIIKPIHNDLIKVCHLIKCFTCKTFFVFHYLFATGLNKSFTNV